MAPVFPQLNQCQVLIEDRYYFDNKLVESDYCDCTIVPKVVTVLMQLMSNNDEYQMSRWLRTVDPVVPTTGTRSPHFGRTERRRWRLADSQRPSVLGPVGGSQFHGVSSNALSVGKGTTR